MLGTFLRDVMKLNMSGTQFPRLRPGRDGIEPSGRALFEVTNRQWDAARSCRATSHLAPDGRVMEVLSEHQCQGWLEGYLLTGRHGFFSCYEAFIHIVDSMFNQHAKWLKVTRDISVAPADRLVELSADLARLAAGSQRLQPSGPRLHRPRGEQEGRHRARLSAAGCQHCLLSVTDHCLRSRHYVNVIVAGKQPAPQWLDMDAAVKHCTAGIGIWQWASNDQGGEPDVVMACCRRRARRWRRWPPSRCCASIFPS